MKTLLVASYKVFIDGLKAGVPTCAPLLERWKQQGGSLGFIYFHNSRGINDFEDFDGLVSIGDPFPQVDAVRLRAAELDADDDLEIVASAARELAQVHGRLRTRRRTANAWLCHVGTVAPIDWGENVDIQTTPRGPEATPVNQTEAAEVAELVKRLGGVPKAAGKVGGSERSLRRYIQGARAVPGAVLEALRAAVGVAGSSGASGDAGIGPGLPINTNNIEANPVRFPVLEAGSDHMVATKGASP